MQTTLKCRMKSYIQPFERKLALMELKVMTGSEPEPLSLWGESDNAFDFVVISSIPAAVLARRLAYWEYIVEDQKHYTAQVLREATVNVVRNGIPLEQIAQLVPFKREIPLPNRRCLRYGTHGIHEYRGKFFPQLVRALMNIASIPTHGIVADPMSGSGTTVVEAVLAGHQGLGLDLNPLSVLIARTKCALLLEKPETIIYAYQHIREQLLRIASPRPSRESSYFSTLSVVDQQYLSGWFSDHVLCDLDEVTRAIYTLQEEPVRNFMLLVLSNILRKVSWQKDDDLRVRKEVKLDNDIDPIREFLEELGRSVRTLLAFLYQNQGFSAGTYNIQEGDARVGVSFWNTWAGEVDAIITSPPYATALPYLDTDRLSLCYLQLLPRPEHRRRDQHMIGNREITESGRQSYWQLFHEKKTQLPESVIHLVERVEYLNSRANVGFRRRNLSALLAKYFFDMQEVFANFTKLLKPGASAYVIVGNNHTVAGGERVEIETPDLLADIAISLGLQPAERIPMEMLISRDIFKKNAMSAEVILAFRRPI